ncbi:Hypothetical protein PP7435_CHR3-1039 [Komagataella phaffii CBS 7435]|uniref:Uncharacterized protein n=2 Tax=Komagataella phaffii TaxID=460519 RepID=C4R3T5_KOMPG|nr:Hypothetical protein PAS_chr3_0192 [Komagataella phaffii GS115]AOA63603.1 GQ67_03231T0 [Komagataella phaffii]CAH2450043.1 Hypothetical protein BQ9382_C3-5465 [Komagataella phaffii CBS 7435]AOA69118.1 GQ68_03200T0 [Komagataella phaffii GS115]CAY70174.1 Hypothetical protein PAS_chr3_0192 [Komagataella phaffii GS115]SCV12295.1 Hypothetical protein PP7435_CHR3-1039 [Komagataella phaffii CBS 7435]
MHRIPLLSRLSDQAVVSNNPALRRSSNSTVDPTHSLSHRRLSQETLTTLINPLAATGTSPAIVENVTMLNMESRIDSDTESLQATLTEDAFGSVFEVPAISYTYIRKLPIVTSNFFGKSVHVFASKLDVEQFKAQGKNGEVTPILTLHSQRGIQSLKKNSPQCILYSYDGKDRVEHARMYHDILKNNNHKYTMVFRDSSIVVLINSKSGPFTDCEFKSTRLRFLGTTGSYSTFGSRAITAVTVTNNDIELLTDGYSVDELASSNDLKPKLNKVAVKNIKELSKFIPFATLRLEPTSVITKRIQKVGEIQTFDHVDSRIPSSNCMAMLAVLLVLREQETMKIQRND